MPRTVVGKLAHTLMYEELGYLFGPITQRP